MITRSSKTSNLAGDSPDIATVLQSVRATNQESQGSARQMVYEQLRSKILGAELLPGSSLPENLMANVLEVSRTPLREALQRLQSDGLVQVIPQVGTFVARLELSRIQDALFVREAVECTALASVTGPIGEAALDELNAAVQKHHEAVEHNDLPSTMQHDAVFHRVLLGLAGKASAWRYVHEAREMHRRVRVLARSQTNLASVRKSVEQHREIVEALMANRLSDAQEILRSHIRMNLHLAEEIAQIYPSYFVD